MIAIVAAMPQELAAILAAAHAEGEVHTEMVAGRQLRRATLAGRDVVLALSGVGKAAAAATAALLAERAEAMIMVGTAGGLGATVNPGDVVVATELLQHDFDARPLWDRWVSPSIGLARVPADPALAEALFAAAELVCAQHRPDLAALGLGVPQVHRGLVISGDVFVATAEASAKLQAELPEALAVEMEGAALAQTCYTAGVPFAVARTVSDRADHDAALDFPKFLDGVAAPYAHDLVLAALAQL
ncbi:5'-methylthioadenosine/adenosylhomocysteine nucleosidase [Propionicimonas sp.]|uniref:5'-methylthioadenosine/adenosylhomocysteine nucleosidase n=1 Tax=Propionicimonas sp. TaxID=1955623 RepID=UPI0017A3101D|nr:5'-methylthioadenosine/adenosylhomocysteine nucleosidase [Propionicimonas sp.]MBU3975873.1 5'-methylthioadenosine/adenosylhomocysteine nucleosidase [Actinomycetota bacterium]MBA3022140.1 5'-methylthioadenosine/adenosylhomocysteine nucleosidase [Propionicimonas sp.]MBU3987423.1 5'-methylthioadenosine/adenosylhomocysteine nucleosidase [Actinomycetota bacterium]MBU4006632.1 5'-methylthioadenosine/adenosylhomocysteine nucleosidase [Actinomycetota bacterium]MBU4065237.1 5'-methylthioadenosine/ad